MGCTTILGQKFGKDCDQADLLYAKAAYEKSQQKQEKPKEWTPLQIFGVVGGSLLAITIMTVILIKAKKAKQ